MALCIVCGKETEDGCLCTSCSESVDKQKLIKDILNYKPGSGINELWDSISFKMRDYAVFKHLIFPLTEDMPTPRKEYLRMLSLANGSADVPKSSRPWLYGIYEALKQTKGLTLNEKNRVRGIVLGALYMDYRYEEADEIAGKLLEQEELPLKAYYNLAKFLMYTRRYDEAEDAIASAINHYGKYKGVLSEYEELRKKNEEYRNAVANGKKEYMPSPKEDKEAARKKYVDFLASIGIEAELPSAKKERKSRYPIPIPKDQYPKPVEVREADFDSFVAFDFETTGLNSTIDSIIEVGAVKVVNGYVSEQKEFTFQEFVKPYNRSVKPFITELTGITKDDVKDARQMWEVIPDFMEFVGDSVLVGFNSIPFDSKFLARAGRYSNLIIENPHFDVKRYAARFSDELGLEKSRISLGTLAERLEIENPQAHRALADALTTARAYLKLREMDKNDEKSVEVDDILADLDEW